MYILRDKTGKHATIACAGDHIQVFPWRNATELLVQNSDFTAPLDPHLGC